MKSIIQIDTAKRSVPFRSVFQFDQEREGFLSVYMARINIDQKEFLLHKVGDVPDTIEMRKLIQSCLEMDDHYDLWWQPLGQEMSNW